MTKRILAKRAELLLVGFAIAIAVALPFYTHTSTYPIAIVQGNSMYPTLQNGDLVIFRSQAHPIVANSSIIVFVEGATGVSDWTR
jgi:signal peptidase I